MDTFEPESFESAEQSKIPNPAVRKNRKKRNSDGFWNFLTIFFLLLILMIFGYFALIFTHPETSLNPFPVKAIPLPALLPTFPPTDLPPTPTHIKIPTYTPTSTFTPGPPTPTAIIATPISQLTEITATETDQPSSYYSYTFQSEPQLIDGTLFNPSHGCTWMGVAGQALDLKNRPVPGIKVELGGFLDGKYLSMISLTGTALQYGQSGYEFTLSDKPIAAKEALWVRLLDQSDIPLTGRVVFSTSTDCTHNLVIINFKQAR